MSEELAITNEDWYAEYVGVIYRTLNEMIHLSTDSDLITFAKEWEALSSKQRTWNVSDVALLSKEDHVIYHVIRMTMAPTASVMFEYSEDTDLSIFGTVEELDSYYSYDHAYTYNDMLFVLTDACTKLLKLTGVTVDPRVYSAANTLTYIFHQLLAFGKGETLTSQTLTNITDAFIKLDDYITETNDDEDEEGYSE